MNFRLALVTGATSGIGTAVCELLASKKIALLATGRDFSKLQKLQQRLSSQVEIKILAVDLSKKEERACLIQWIHQEVPDLVINNAGFGLYGEALSYSTAKQGEVLEVNGQALLELTLEACRTLRTFHRSGVILNVSSIAAFHPLSYMAVYAASKAFVNSFSQALDFECTPYGIRILTLCPGRVETNFQQRAGGKKHLQADAWMTPAFVAKKIWQQIEGGFSLKIINWTYQVIHFFSHFFSTSLIAALIKKVLSARMMPRNFITTDVTHDN